MLLFFSPFENITFEIPTVHPLSYQLQQTHNCRIAECSGIVISVWQWEKLERWLEWAVGERRTKNQKPELNLKTSGPRLSSDLSKTSGVVQESFFFKPPSLSSYEHTNHILHYKRTSTSALRVGKTPRWPDIPLNTALTERRGGVRRLLSTQIVL